MTLSLSNKSQGHKCGFWGGVGLRQTLSYHLVTYVKC